MGARPLDNSHSAIKNWAFMTVHNWGEDPRGAWTIEVLIIFVERLNLMKKSLLLPYQQVKDNKGTVKSCNRPNNEFQGVFVQDISLVFWGTSGGKW